MLLHIGFTHKQSLVLLPIKNHIVIDPQFGRLHLYPTLIIYQTPCTCIFPILYFGQFIYYIYPPPDDQHASLINSIWLLTNLSEN